MTKLQKRNQKIMKRNLKRTITINLIICFIIMIVSLVKTVASKPNDDFLNIKEEQNVPDVIVVKETKKVTETKLSKFIYSKDFDAEESYLLAKIAMAEAEGCSVETKCLIILTVLNRVNDPQFPNTIEEVIFQKRGNTYQFSPIGDGRWNRVEPNEECWEALDKVLNMTEDISQGALYFESCKDENNWHSRNLIFLCKSDSMRFYKH